MIYYTIPLRDINYSYLDIVGGKNASLGEMIQNVMSDGVRVPHGFAVTTHVFDEFLEYNNDLNSQIKKHLSIIVKESDSPTAGYRTLKLAGKNIRELILKGTFPEHIESSLHKSYYKLCKEYSQIDLDVAVRSSSTAEDLENASFAGQQDTYLNISGFENLLISIKRCFASLYNDCAIDYRNVQGYTGKLSLSVCIQKMVRSDIGCAGVAFSLDTESGFRGINMINASWGLGEMVVSGKVEPDEFIVYKQNRVIIDKKLGSKKLKMVYANQESSENSKVVVDEVETANREQNMFCMSDSHVLELNDSINKIEKHYAKPIDVEWALDGLDNQLYIVQARPETVCSQKDNTQLTRYILQNSSNEDPIATGIAVGDLISHGTVCYIPNINSIESSGFKRGDILLTEITDPNWEPIMKISGGIITQRGGRTCHAAIVARELGVPAIVGCGDTIFDKLSNKLEITMSCAQGETGRIYGGNIPFDIENIDLTSLPKINSTNLMLNVGNPTQAFRVSHLPNKGVGLAREEFLINNFIKIHPLALLNYLSLENLDLQKTIDDIIVGYDNPKDYFVSKLAYGIARIGAAFDPHPVIVRFSDFKSNEYANLIGGKIFEPQEENPMIGWRGASRYYSEQYEEAFGLECQAIKRVREEMGLKNIVVMIPFCRSIFEIQQVLATMEKYGLKRGENGLQVFLMCELPANVVLANEFCKYVDGFSIGSNDLTQLTMGLDRDSHLVSHLFDERNDAVKIMISSAIKACKQNGVKIGICGDAPSSFPDFTEFLVECGIDSVSVTPDAYVKTVMSIHEAEKKILDSE